MEEIGGGTLARVHARGKKLMKGIAVILQRLGVPAIVQGPPSMFGVVFSDKGIVLNAFEEA